MGLRVVHITEDFSMANTGVTTSLRELITHVSGPGTVMEVVAAGADAVSLLGGAKVRLCPLSTIGSSWRYSPGLAGALRNALTEDAVLHIHGVWMAPQWQAARLSAAAGVPSVLSPHNMLGGWFWRRGLLRRIKKNLYWRLFSGPAFGKVTVLHALNPMERDDLHGHFPGKRVEVIPNGIDLAEVDENLFSAQRPASDAPYLLFLGRLHPVKGIELLIDAYASVPAPSRLPLVIAGPPCTDGYLAELKERVGAGGLEKVEFAGVVSGDRKWSLIRGARAVVAPSYSEGMSVVALESMAASVPVITTFAAGISDIPDGGGLLLNPSAGELTVALLQVCSWSEAERASRGAAARSLVERRYSWSVVAPLYRALYGELKNNCL